MARDDLQALRAEVRKRHQDVTKKISRMRRVNGVEVGGTRYDVRRDLENVKGYTRAQLRAYKRELDQFQSRGTAFGAGGDGKPLPVEKVRQYNALKKRWNARVDRNMRAIEGVHIEPLGKSVRQRRAERSNEGFPGIGEDATDRINAKISRDPWKIRGEKNLDRMIRDLEKRFDSGYEKKRLAAQRKQFRQMASVIGMSPDVKKLVRGMDDYSFNLFWNETNAAEQMGNSYFIHNNATESRRQGLAGVLEVADSQVAGLARWASRQSGKRGKG